MTAGAIIFICIMISWTVVSPVVIFATWNLAKERGRQEGRKEILDRENSKDSEKQSSWHLLFWEFTLASSCQVEQRTLLPHLWS